MLRPTQQCQRPMTQAEPSRESIRFVGGGRHLRGLPGQADVPSSLTSTVNRVKRQTTLSLFPRTPVPALLATVTRYICRNNKRFGRFYGAGRNANAFYAHVDFNKASDDQNGSCLHSRNGAAVQNSFSITDKLCFKVPN